MRPESADEAAAAPDPDGITEEMLTELGDYENSAHLAPSWKVALKLADHMSGTNNGAIPEALYAQMQEHFNEAQILRLGALLAVASGWQRMIEAFGIRPDHYVDGEAGPWR